MGNDAPPEPPLDRPALAELVTTAARSRICAVIAAAGWGKTTVVRYWPLVTAWVRPESQPTDTKRFAASLLEALSPHVSAPPPALADLATATGDGSASYTATVCAWLRTSLRDHVAVVIDDLHALPPDSGAARIVEGLCRHAPDRLHVVLVSRREPPFSLTQLRGRGLVGEIHAADLAFGLGEVATLLQATAGKCSPELTRQVWERTVGWPAAVHLAVEMLRGVREDERLEVLDRLVRPGERFHSYITEEVIEPEPESVRHLLRWMAVLGVVRPVSATATGVADTPALLADLERRGLVTRIAGRRDHWALARPLRDYFDQEPVLSSAERAALHRAAAIEYAEGGSFTKALRHATAARDSAVCAALLSEHGTSLVNGGQADAVLAAAELPGLWLDDTNILQVLGHALLTRGQWACAQECFRRAGRDQDALEPALAWRLGMIAYNQGEYQQVFDLRDRTRPRDGDTADEARLLALVAAARRMVGDYASCRTEVQRAVMIAQRCADPSAMAACHTVLSALAAAEGDRRQADAHAASALTSAEAAGDLLQALRVRVQHASILGELGLAREALVKAEEAIELGERYGDVLLVAQARTTHATACARLGILGPALTDFGAARDTFQRLGSRLLAWPLCGLGDMHRMRGQLARARAAYEEALALAEPCHDVLGMGSALVGLARVRAVDDPAEALWLAERAIGLGEGMRQVQALLTRGWVAAVTGDWDRATEDAALAATAARRRRDDPGLAEALLLGAMCSPDPNQRDRAITEAISIWQEIGYRVDEAATLLVASRVGTPSPGLGAAFAVETLQAQGVELGAPRPAGPLAVLARSASSVSIRVLGAFQVIRNGVPVPRGAWRSRKARQLLKIVVARGGRPVPREQLMELLWPDADPTRAGNRLSVLLSALRDVLQPGSEHAEPGPLMTDGTGVWLDYHLVDVDVERFREDANAALEAHRHRRPDALLRLIAAEAEHTGEFLEEDPYQEWAAALAEEIRATHIALLRALVSSLREAGEIEEVVRYALRLLEKDPYDEQTHIDLVDVLLAAGRHGEARRRYGFYLRAMAELGVTPQPFNAVEPSHLHRSGSRFVRA
jgi:ATP/maltotriose-dependent transcriptional regulator MalT/DNA-binding SARP family transcriptional activator